MVYLAARIKGDNGNHMMSSPKWREKFLDHFPPPTPKFVEILRIVGL